MLACRRAWNLGEPSFHCRAGRHEGNEALCAAGARNCCARAARKCRWCIIRRCVVLGVCLHFVCCLIEHLVPFVIAPEEEDLFCTCGSNTSSTWNKAGHAAHRQCAGSRTWSTFRSLTLLHHASAAQWAGLFQTVYCTYTSKTLGKSCWSFATLQARHHMLLLLKRLF